MAEDLLKWAMSSSTQDQITTPCAVCATFFQLFLHPARELQYS